VILVKAGLPEAQSPEDAMVHPSERRLKPVPRPALAWHAGGRNLRDGERYLVKIFKEMIGSPKSRYIRTTRTNVGSPTGRAAPRGALSYPQLSWEEFGGIIPESNGLLGSERTTGDNSMPLKQWSCPGTRSEVLRDSSDMVEARLPEPQSPEDVKLASVGKVPETGAAPCIGVSRPLMQPPRGGAIPSEGI
jgi:hypothetical protein